MLSPFSLFSALRLPASLSVLAVSLSVVVSDLPSAKRLVCRYPYSSVLLLRLSPVSIASIFEKNPTKIDNYGI
ncbi:hypothetical protein L484_012151 [Morus notabilis]|uniref:Secreted protein n=1 Tax=Morus notabilis TaxID=981085 RepID=W9R7A0_9ROSA|nr:hypothetical protein L484_012151 [Morus notabilis]